MKYLYRYSALLYLHQHDPRYRSQQHITYQEDLSYLELDLFVYMSSQGEEVTTIGDMNICILCCEDMTEGISIFCGGIR